ncbi:MAG: hypothetical protein KBB62_02425 [Candidatus Pacebacteria bacterium]|nr:hypothetical protein [Candidatus Paceibacterota bacterium]
MLKRVTSLLQKYKFEGILLLIISLFVFIQKLDLIKSIIMLLSCVLIILLLNKTFLYKGIKKAILDIKKEYLYSVLILIFVVILFIWNFSFESIIFLTIFIVFAIYDWDSRITATGALISLSSCPILLIAKQDALAETMAVYAYFFLVMTVVLQIIEYKRHPELFKDEDDEKE